MSNPKVAADIVAAGAALQVFVGWLPPVLGSLAAILGIVWYVIQIYESTTFKRLVLRKAEDIRNETDLH